MSLSFSEIVGAERMKTARIKYNQFLDSLNDPQKPPVRIFSPLDMDQIELVRDVSKYLQKKKEEEVNAEDVKRVEETKTVSSDRGGDT